MSTPKQYVLMPGVLDRFRIPDLYPHGPGGTGTPQVPWPNTPPPFSLPEGGVTIEPIDDSPYLLLTLPGQRPRVVQQGLNFSLAIIANTPQPLSVGRLEVDSILLDVYSTAANSIFWGYGSNVTTTNGIELRVGLPQVIAADNTREQWELQRQLEFIAALLCKVTGDTPLPPFKSPRVVFDASNIWVTAAANTALSGIFFYPAEAQ